MSFLAFGAGFVNALNNRKREERAEEATIRGEERAFQIAKKKATYIALQNRLTSFETARLEFMDQVSLGKVPDPDNPDMPLTINSKSYETILNRYDNKINETNILLSGGTIPELPVETDKKPTTSVTDPDPYGFKKQEREDKAREAMPRLDIGMTRSFRDIGITDPLKPEKKPSIVERITGPSLRILKGFLEPGGYSKYVGEPFANWVRSGGAKEFGINTLEDLKNKKVYNLEEMIKKFETFNYEERK